MTNGEKIKEIFPTFEFIEETEKYRTPQHQFLKVHGVNKMPYMEFDIGWWNAEYKEPIPKNDLGVDCISREEVMEQCQEWRNLEFVKMTNPYYYLEKRLKALPSVTPQEPRWIPTSERLPEEDGEYCVTIYDKDEDYKYTDIAELEDGVWQYKSYIKVLAWAPLPKEYNAVKEFDNSMNDLESEEDLEQE